MGRPKSTKHQQGLSALFIHLDGFVHFDSCSLTAGFNGYVLLWCNIGTLPGRSSHWGCLFLKLFAPKILWRNHAFPSFTTFNHEPGNLIHSFGLCKKKNSQIPGSMVLGLGVPEVGHFVLLREVLLPEGRQTGFLWALRPALWFQCHIFWNLSVGSLFQAQAMRNARQGDSWQSRVTFSEKHPKLIGY